MTSWLRMILTFSRSIRLLALVSCLLCTARVGAYDESPAVAPGYREMSQEQLQLELDETSMAGPIALLGSGGGLVIAGVGMLAIGQTVKSNCVFDTTCQAKSWQIAAVPTLGIGVVLATVGGIWLGSVLETRGRIKKAMSKYHAQSPAHWQIGVTSLAGGQSLEFRLQF
jgi:hypothetical protein